MLACLAVWAALGTGISLEAVAQAPNPTTTAVPQEAPGEDADPTRPVVWSLRQEYYHLRDDAWTNVVIIRKDQAFFEGKPGLGGKRGWLTRFDLPFVVSHGQGETQGGLGDLYAQVLYIPHLTRRFALATGTGFSFPTATDRLLGTGKWAVAPAVAPVWFFERGFFYVRLQDFISVAGDESRPDLHYLTTTPTLVWRIKKKWWIQLETEAKTNFENSGNTGFKSGFLVGRMVKGRLGVWVRPEVYWGRYREGDFVIKTSIFRVKPRQSRAAKPAAEPETHR
jgi:hypothetical protein